MGFIQTIIDQHQKKVQERNDACNDVMPNQYFLHRKCSLILTPKPSGEAEIAEY